MPDQMPPAAWMAGESRSTMTMSSPGAMPSSSTPMTSPVNGSGVTPCETVLPVTGSPAARLAIG